MSLTILINYTLDSKPWSFTPNGNFTSKLKCPVILPCHFEKDMVYIHIFCMLCLVGAEKVLCKCMCIASMNIICHMVCHINYCIVGYIVYNVVHYSFSSLPHSGSRATVLQGFSSLCLDSWTPFHCISPASSRTSTEILGVTPSHSATPRCWPQQACCLSCCLTWNRSDRKWIQLKRIWGNQAQGILQMKSHYRRRSRL